MNRAKLTHGLFLLVFNPQHILIDCTVSFSHGQSITDCNLPFISFQLSQCFPLCSFMDWSWRHKEPASAMEFTTLPDRIWHLIISSSFTRSASVYVGSHFIPVVFCNNYCAFSWILLCLAYCLICHFQF